MECCFLIPDSWDDEMENVEYVEALWVRWCQVILVYDVSLVPGSVEELFLVLGGDFVVPNEGAYYLGDILLVNRMSTVGIVYYLAS